MLLTTASDSQLSDTFPVVLCSFAVSYYEGFGCNVPYRSYH